MHETGIVRDVLRQIERVAKDANARQVSGVHVRLGALSGFSSEHFCEHFEVESRGTIAEGASVVVTVAAAVDEAGAQDVTVESVDLEIAEDD